MSLLEIALQIGEKAAQLGFDWENAHQILDKIVEEVEEIRQATPEHLLEEIGDLLFATVQLARKSKVMPDQALSYACHKFEMRFQWMKENLPDLSRQPMDILNRYWDQAKVATQSTLVKQSLIMESNLSELVKEIQGLRQEIQGLRRSQGRMMQTLNKAHQNLKRQLNLNREFLSVLIRTSHQNLSKYFEDFEDILENQDQELQALENDLNQLFED